MTKLTHIYIAAATLALLAALALTLASCSDSHSATVRIDTAEEAMAAGDMKMAREICDDMLPDTAAMTAEELGRLSIIFMKISDKTDDTTAVDSALDCFRQAYSRDNEAATTFYRSQSVDNDRYVMMLASIVRALDHPGEIPADEEIAADSCYLPASH